LISLRIPLMSSRVPSTSLRYSMVSPRYYSSNVPEDVYLPRDCSGFLQMSLGIDLLKEFIPVLNDAIGVLKDFI
jgi:hypothetical protein